jgi:mannose-6-phosphate isomerase-like protein (cupin superfamily)
VLSGRARFYGEEHVLLADMGQYEGVLLPRGVPYWFESGSDEPLELLQIEGSDIAMNSQKELTSDRKDYEPPKQRATASYVNAPD